MSRTQYFRDYAFKVISTVAFMLTLTGNVFADGGSAVFHKLYKTESCPAGYSGSITYVCSYNIMAFGPEYCLKQPVTNTNRWRVDSSTCVISNIAPSVSDQVLTLHEDNAGSVTLNAYDPDSPAPYTFTLLNLPPAGAGYVSLNGSTVTFTPAPNWNGQVSLQFTATDNQGAVSAPATLTINVIAVNDPPVVANQVLNIDEDVPGSLALSATDVENNVPFSYQVISVVPSNAGTASISGSTFTFYPSANWNGQATVQYRATDSEGAVSAPAVITVNVRPVNDPPVVADRVLNINEDTVGTLSLSATDIENNVPFTFKLISVSPGGSGTAQVANNVFTFTPALNWNGQVIIQYQATDSGGAVSAPARITVNIAPVNDKPVLTSTPIRIRTKESTAVTVRATVSP